MTLDPMEFKSPANLKKHIDMIINDRMKDIGVTSYLCPFIMSLSTDEGVSHKELTEGVCVHKSLTTRAMKVLFTEGYAENRTTGKEYSIFLTEQGEMLRKEIKQRITETMESILADLTPEERDLLKKLYGKITDRVEKMVEEIKDSTV